MPRGEGGLVARDFSTRDCPRPNPAGPKTEKIQFREAILKQSSFQYGMKFSIDNGCFRNARFKRECFSCVGEWLFSSDDDFFFSISGLSGNNKFNCVLKCLPNSGSFLHPQPPKSADVLSESGSQRKVLSKGNLILLTTGVKVQEIAVGADFAPTTFSLARVAIRDLVADGKSLVRNSGVGVGGQNLILTNCLPPKSFRGKLFTYNWSFLLTVKLLCLQSLKALIRHTFPQ